jgi:CRP-like cAMP-binding protein
MAEERPLDVERVLYLGSLPLFGNLPPHELALLAEYASEKRVKGGTVLHGRGEVVGSLYVVVEGNLALTRNGQKLGKAGPREAVGVLGLLAGADEGIEVCTEGECVLLEIEGDAVRDVFEEHFSILDHAIGATCRMVREARRQIPQDAGYPAPASTSSIRRRKDLDLVERILFLRSTLMMRHAPIRALAELAKVAEEMVIAPGEAIWHEGDDEVEWFLVLVSGTVTARTKAGQTFSFGATDAIGVLDALANQPRWYEATADQEIVALKIEAEGLEDVLEDHVEMGLELLSMLAGQAISASARASLLPSRRASLANRS